MAVLGWLAEDLAGPPWSVPLPPPHAARSVPALDSVRPAAPSRFTSSRRDTRPSTTRSKNRSSSRSGSGIGGLLLCYEDRVGWVPCKGHVAAGPDRLGLRSEAILLDGGELLAAGRVHHVLDRGAEEARYLDAAAKRVRAARRVDPGGHERQLLGTYAHSHRVAVQLGPDPVGGHAQPGAVPGLELGHVAAPDAELAVHEVAVAQEVRDELRGRALVEVGRAALLLHPPLVHHGDRVCHGHRLFLVVRHVHERDADLPLDPLELDLELL